MLAESSSNIIASSIRTVPCARVKVLRDGLSMTKDLSRSRGGPDCASCRSLTSLGLRSRESRTRVRFGGNGRGGGGVFPPDQIETAGDDDSTANVNAARRQYSPDDPIDEDSPQERGVLEWRHDRRRCPSKRFGEQMLADCGEDADGRQEYPILVTQRNPVRRGHRSCNDRQQADHPEHHTGSCIAAADDAQRDYVERICRGRHQRGQRTE